MLSIRERHFMWPLWDPLPFLCVGAPFSTKSPQCLLHAANRSESSVLWARHGSSQYHFYAHSIGRCSVAEPPLIQRLWAKVVELVPRWKPDQFWVAHSRPPQSAADPRICRRVGALYNGLLHFCWGTLLSPIFRFSLFNSSAQGTSLEERSYSQIPFISHPLSHSKSHSFSQEDLRNSQITEKQNEL